MGDLGEASKESRTIHILVSGAGPFQEHTRNPANIIASGLSSRLSIREKSLPYRLDIAVHPSPTPWRVSYSWIKEQIPPMLFSPVSASQAGPKSSTPLPNYDIVLFIGMAAGRSYYSMETQAHRDGYKLPDVDGMTIIGDDYWTRLGAPEIIRTGFDVDLLFGRWRQNVPDEIDVQTSDDAGRYLCDYIYYTGLCEYWLHSGKDMTNDRPVLFLHVPGEADDETIKRGVLVAEGLIKAMAVTWAGRTGVEKIK